jgi:hypothetical protein
MPARVVKERLAQDVALWQAEGLISEETGRLLRERYDTPGFGLATLVRYLGITGGLFAVLGLLGLLAAVAGSELVGALLTAALALAFLWAGVRLSQDPKGRYPHSAKVVLLLGLLSLGGALFILLDELIQSDSEVLLMGGLLWLPVPFALAYRFRNTFALILGLLVFFHWVGSWTAMGGRSSYVIAIEMPLLMAVAALAAIGVGTYHELRLQERTLRFYQAYQVLGLIYLDLSLLILTFSTRSESAAVFFILLLTGASLGQIVLGARLANPLFTGFGVTSLALNLFTRYHELMWDRLERGLYFLLGGALLFGFGVAAESLARRWGHPEGPA